METKTYTHVDKSAWGPGPWQDEPDKIQWQDEETGLPCLAVRNRFMGHWCGYVGVDETHPLFSLTAHGGLTYSSFCQEDEKEHGICHIPAPGEPDRVWWFGFDCAHAGDLSPGYIAGLPSDLRMFRGGDAYRSLEYVQAQCRQLAKQLKSLPTID